MSKYVGKIITNQAAAGYSVFFDGSGDFLTTPWNASLNVGSGTSWTIEFWGNVGAAFGTYCPISFVQDITNRWGVEIGASSTNVVFGTPGAVSFTHPSTLSINTWFHFALVRDGSTVRLYINGVVSSTTSTNNLQSLANTAVMYIGRNNVSGFFFDWNGSISNFRITQGVAVYTANFTPPTQLFRTTNTSLLTCNSPAIVDQSSNAFAITTNGNAAVSTFTPFAAYNPYNPALGASTPGVWTLDEAMQAAATRQWNMYDPYFQNTTLLLHGNGTNAAQNNTFLDSSSNNFTITRNGNTTQGSFSPFSQTGWGLRTNDRSYLTIPASSDFDLISTDFTVEFWFNLNALNNMAYSGSSFFGNGLATAVNGWALGTNDSGSSPATEIKFTTWQAGSAATNTFSGLTLNFGTWYHVVLQRNGAGSGNLRLFINGVQQGAAQTANTYSSAGSTFTLGSGAYTQNATYSGNADYYISNVRLTKSAVYSTSGFTPPTSNLSALGATTLLICQSNRFVNNGTNTGAITSTSWTSTLAQIVPFSPFYPTAAYTPATIGGSGYFDGTGDFLELTDSSNVLDIGGVVASIECWFYPMAQPAFGILISKGGGAANWSATNGFEYQLSYTSGTFTVYYNIGGGNSTFIANTTTSPLNQWYHVAVATDASNNLSLFVNGTRVATTTNAITKPTTRTMVRIANDVSASHPTGYISGMRVIVGTGAYSASSSTLTVPTAPPTAVTNTRLLTNFTNAGIVDSTAKNVLETVGNAQISTAVSKFGGSSMAFDGNGDYLVTPFTQLFNMWQGDSTVECWVYFNSLANAPHIWSIGESDTNRVTLYVSSSVFRLYTRTGAGAADRITSATTLSTGRWYHVAVTKNNGTWTLWLDGVSQGTSTTTVFPSGPAENLGVGFQHYGGAAGDYLNGYIDDLRITRGVARYTGNFTPQTSQWQDQ